jgi:hypothetical protein
MATNQDAALDPASSPATGPLTEFTLFPTLPFELQFKIWRCCIRQANIIHLRLDFHRWSFSEPPLHPVLHTSRGARTEALRSLAILPSFPRSGRYTPDGDSMDKIELDMSNDIFLLQIELQDCRAPNKWQKQEYKIAEQSFNLRHRATSWSQGQPQFVFKPTETLWVEPDDQETNYLGMAAGDGRPLCLAQFQNIAIRLSLRPFNFQYHTEDEWWNRGGQYHRGTQDKDGNWIGGTGNPQNYTNLERWAVDEVFEFLESVHDAVFLDMPKVTKVYVFVPEKGKPYWSHYEYNETLYPRAGEREFLHWTEARDGDLIYSTKELQLIERVLQSWVETDGKPGKPEGAVWPEIRLVVADYAGREY